MSAFHMDQQQRIKVLRDWAAGKFRSPVPHNGGGTVKPVEPKETAVRPASRHSDLAKRIYTSVWGDNAELMERAATLYFKPGDRIADVTYGRGAFCAKSTRRSSTSILPT